MKVQLKPGKYVLAVSGGVDSMVLLDLLFKKTDVEIVVAHFDHGIREDSASDRQFVQKKAQVYGLIFEYAEGKLGVKASEDIARKARYQFLNSVRQKQKAIAIITAHHQDDLIETALLNMLRGTGRKGLTSLSSTKEILRPLLNMTKPELINYAKTNRLTWREDTTNQKTDYLRNYIRIKIIPKLTSEKREQLVSTIDKLKTTNMEIDLQIAKYLQFKDSNKAIIDKKLVNELPHQVACEVLAEWLRLNNIRQFDRKAIERLVVAAKTLWPGHRIDVNNKNYISIEKNTLVIRAQDSSIRDRTSI